MTNFASEGTCPSLLVSARHQRAPICCRVISGACFSMKLVNILEQLWAGVLCSPRCWAEHPKCQTVQERRVSAPMFAIIRYCKFHGSLKCPIVWRWIVFCRDPSYEISQSEGRASACQLHQTNSIKFDSNSVWGTVPLDFQTTWVFSIPCFLLWSTVCLNYHGDQEDFQLRKGSLTSNPSNTATSIQPISTHQARSHGRNSASSGPSTKTSEKRRWRLRIGLSNLGRGQPCSLLDLGSLGCCALSIQSILAEESWEVLWHNWVLRISSNLIQATRATRRGETNVWS